MGPVDSSGMCSVLRALVWYMVYSWCALGSIGGHRICFGFEGQADGTTALLLYVLKAFLGSMQGSIQERIRLLLPLVLQALFCEQLRFSWGGRL